MVSVIQFVQGRERGPSDAIDLVLCREPHDPVYNKIEKHCGHDATLPDTSPDFKRDVTITDTAGNVVKGNLHSDKKFTSNHTK